MSAECCEPRRRLARVGLAYTPAALLALLLPKCPLCLGAVLALLGVNLALPSASYGLLVLAGVVLGTLIVLAQRRSTSSLMTRSKKRY